MSARSVSSSRKAWTAALEGMRTSQPTYKLSLLLVLLEAIDVGRATATSFVHDTRLSDSFDALLLRHGALLGRGRIRMPLDHMSVRRGKQPDQVWRRLPRTRTYEVRPPFVDVLALPAERAWLEGRIVAKLEGAPDSTSRNLLTVLRDSWSISDSVSWMTETASRIAEAGIRDTLGHLGLEVDETGYVGNSGEVEAAVGVAHLIESSDTSMALLKTETQVRVGQRAFRAWVLDNFEGLCSFCELRGRGLVQAAHILPVHERPDRGLDKHNGIALCPNHHAAFDRHLVWVRGAKIEAHAPDGFVLGGLLDPMRSRMRKPVRYSLDRDALQAHASRAMGTHG